MAFFERGKFVWNEPWFFLQRIRGGKSWFLFSLFLSLIAMAMVLVLLLTTAPNNPPSGLTILAASLGVPFVVWWILDGANSRRQAVLYRDTLVVGGDMGKYSTPTTYQNKQIESAVIFDRDASHLPEAALCFVYQGREHAVGIDRQIVLPRLAQALHDVGISVFLDGWSPHQNNPFLAAFSRKVDAKSVQPTAVTQTLPAGTISIMTPGGIALGIVRQCWPLTIWLIAAGFAGYHAYQNWNNLGLIPLAVTVTVVLGGFMLATQVTERFATASMSQGLERMVKSQIAKRDGVQVDVAGPDLMPVEVFERDQFDKAIQKILEMGYIQPDRKRNRLVFEGKKERWQLPSESIRSLVLEEVQCGTPGQSMTGEIKYYVVIHFATAGGDKELGLRYASRDFGSVTDTKRAADGVKLFEALECVLPVPVAPDSNAPISDAPISDAPARVSL